MTPEEFLQRRKEIQQRSYHKHRERILAKKRLYYLANREMLLARVTAWQKAHPDKKIKWTWMAAVKQRLRRRLIKEKRT